MQDNSARQGYPLETGLQKGDYSSKPFHGGCSESIFIRGMRKGEAATTMSMLGIWISQVTFPVQFFLC